MPEMINITVVGAGSYGSRITNKYKKLKIANIRAVISRSTPKYDFFDDLTFLKGPLDWKKKFGKPQKNDVFDMCVHQNILIDLLNDFVRIGARNFILPKPIALKTKELDQIQKLVSKYNLNIVIASQWYYSDLIKKAKEFLINNKSRVSRIDIKFSRPFDSNRRSLYNSKTAFFPHIVQILHSLNLLKEESKPIVEHISDQKIKIKYSENKLIHTESNIGDGKREEILKIFLKGDKKPSLVLDFTTEVDIKDSSTFFMGFIQNKKFKIKEDLLEKMIKANLNYFENLNKNSDVLTFARYLPVAKHIVLASEHSKKVVGIIGGGIFGVLSAIEVAKKGYSVIIFEKKEDIIKGASLINHGRVHMGYHYPRDKKTVLDSLKAKAPFESFFGRKIVRKINNYYMIAKEGSMTSYNDFLKFCKRMHLPYKTLLPSKLKISKDKISGGFKVPETIFDANRMRDFLIKKISSMHNIKLLTKADVYGLNRINGGYAVSYRLNNIEEITNCTVVVNATYGAINYINNLLGLPLQTFQYELCELLVTSTPWKNMGWMIMDGPFFSAMPFGYSGNYLFYDVELSVLERVIDKFPNFKYGIDYYDTKDKRAKRFKKYQEKWRPWVGEFKDHKHLHSMYIPRIVLHKQDKTDKRPTIINEPLPGFWQIFSGKIATSVPEAMKIANKIDRFIKTKIK